MKKILLKHCNILDGTENMTLQQDMDILICDNKISQIDKNISVKANKIVDCSNKYIIPGLINLHVHLPGSGNPKKKATNTVGLIKFIKRNFITRSIGIFICKKNAKTTLYSGVTTIRTVGGISNFDSITRDKINSHKAIGPRIISCDEAIGVKGGHMDQTVAVAANTIEEAIQLVVKTKNGGADWIKLMITGGVLDCKEVGHPGDLKMSEEMVRACVNKAHELGLKVCAHVEGPEGLEIAIKNGVDTIEHGSYVNESLLDEFAKRNGALVQTISPAMPFVYLDPSEHGYGEEGRINGSVLVKGMLDMIDKCDKHHVLVGYGTDVGCPYVTHYNFYNELIFATKLIKNITPIKAIYHSTMVNAKILGLEDKIGSVEVDKYADLLVLNNNPVMNLNTLNKPYFVMKDGKIYKHKVKHNSFIDSKIDKMINQMI